MKKLMIAAFAVAFAAVAQAASINWTASGIYGAGTGALADKTSYTALLFVTNNTTGVGDWTIVTASDVATALKEGNRSIASSAAANKALASNGTIGGATGLSTAFSSGSLSAFAVILDTTTVGDIATASHFYMVNGGESLTATFTSASGAKSLLFGSQADNSQLAIDSSNAAWTTIVPEPTSALMLLVGLAGLALKRKVA